MINDGWITSGEDFAYFRISSILSTSGAYKHQVKPHSSPWFLAASAAAIVHRSHFFRLYQETRFFEFKVKFRQISNRRKSVLEAAKFAYANKTKGSITYQKLGSRDFWQTANGVLNKGKATIPPLFNCSETLSFGYNKAKLFVENLSKNSKLVWHCIIFL